MKGGNLEQHLLRYTYKAGNYPGWLKGFATALDTRVINNTLLLPPAAGRGSLKACQVEEGFSCSLQNYQLDENLEFERLAHEEAGILIHFFYFQFDTPIEYRLETNAENAREKEQFALRLINAAASQQVKLYKGTSVKGLSIYLDKRWIQQHLSEPVLDIFKYIRRVNSLKESVQARYQKILLELMNIAGDHPYADIYIKSRVLRLMDIIFENLLKREISDTPEKISEQDFEMLQKVERMLAEKFTSPFPSIERLARVSLMSESKLKKLFKLSFGMGMHEYYQRNRLHKAKEMMLLNKYSISETGKMLGYQNLSNFSAAFKKEFSCLPSEISRLN